MFASLLVIFIWRFGVRRVPLPCPAWLISLLENPYFEAMAGSAKLLQRATVKPGLSVLDVGCGPGRLTIPAAKIVDPSGEVVALDIREKMLRRVHE